MKWLAVSLLVACSSSPSPPAGGSGSAAAKPAESNDVCELGKAALAQLTACNGKPLVDNIVKGKNQLTAVIDMAKSKGQGGGELQTACAQLIRTFDDELVKVGCALPLAPGTRTRMYDLVEQWYATRTPVVATGNGPADAKLQQLAAIRDEACKCKTDLCLEGITREVDEFGAFGSDAPKAAVELAGKLFDDVSRCNAAITKPVKRHD